NVQNAGIDPDAITGLAPGAIYYGAAAGTTLLIVNGNDATTFNVVGTAESVLTVLNAGADATVNVQTTAGALEVNGAGFVNIGNAGMLDGVVGAVSLGVQ